MSIFTLYQVIFAIKKKAHQILGFKRKGGMKGLIFYDASPPIPALFYPPFHILQQWLPSVSAHMLEKKRLPLWLEATLMCQLFSCK